MFQIDQSMFQVDPWLFIVIIICIIAFIVVAVYWGILAHHRQISAGREELIGKTAEVREALDPKGIVFIQDERWIAIAEQGRFEPGEEVIITRVEGLKLWVTKKE